jgi:uncharacterized repeat protein (TIGR01451 family)
MPDLDDTLGDTSLRDAFESFRAGSLETVIPEGPDAVRHTVRRRHRNRVAAVAVVAALVVLAGGASALAALNPAGNNLPPAGHGSGTPTPSTSTTPSAKPKPSGSEPGGSAPDGQIGANELMNATIDVPAWGGQADDKCSSGRLTFHNGEIDLSNDYRIFMSDRDPTLPPLYFEDVDGDGAKETIVTLMCGVSAGGAYQAVALDRDTSGNIVTLGQIASNGQDTAGFAVISQITTTADGDIQIKWTRQPPGSPASTPQWRTYHWTGSGFEQVSGPTAFPTQSQPPVELSVSAPNVAMTANGDGTYGGTLTVTLTNNGTAPLTQVHLTVNLPDGAKLTAMTSGTSGSSCQITVATVGQCDYSGSLAPGATATATATIHTTSGTIPTDQGGLIGRYGPTSSPLADNESFQLVAG